jgi:hypothetical protein
MTQSDFLEECRYVATAEPGAEAEAMRALSEADEEVVNVPMDKLVCAYHPICDPVEDGMVVWRDDNHLTITYATSLADEIDAYLVEQGVFD